MSTEIDAATTECSFVEVLTDDRSGTVYGYRLTGASAGPQVVVAGMCRTAEDIFERFLALPTLPWMRGTLTLVRLDCFDEATEGAMSLGPVDCTVVLPWVSEDTVDLGTLRRGYYNVLRICAGLGMIQGRGVFRRPVTTA
ncbi:hypothetical protein [Maliponia aquimaris]|uniref:Uncharacterized protein n=1 Tax=Maliponia aquimaris TaxID=1673631 RepID=A0A238K731_9RHOB|nr:hypothetical protein [Maliponia aquimaris]SMX38613.1 hypothetical protein MAA8898_01631 [Maliponia aquimaris]